MIDLSNRVPVLSIEAQIFGKVAKDCDRNYEEKWPDQRTIPKERFGGLSERALK
jgi:hypothetical protein